MSDEENEQELSEQEEVSDSSSSEGVPDDPELAARLKKKKRKANHVNRLRDLVKKFKNVLVCNFDFVGSNQLQQVRVALRGKATILMGKNTVVRKILREEARTNPKLTSLIPACNGNVGFVFTNGDLAEVRKIIIANQVPAAAKSGNIAPIDVFVPPGPTGMDPGQTSFFQALNISTKISRGAIEILNEVHLIPAGTKVTASHVSLLAKLDIKPFSYGIVAVTAYENGSVYDAAILDMSTEDLMNKWYAGVRNVAALSIELGMPTAASIPYSIRNAIKKLYAICFATKYEFKEFKDLASGAAAAPAAKKEEKKAAPKAAAKEESEAEESSDGAIGGGMFGGGDEEEEDEEEWDEEEEEEEE